jgi:hypothetical protein
MRFSPFVDASLIVSLHSQVVIHQCDIAQIDRSVFQRIEVN